MGKARGRTIGYTEETISKLLILRSVYKDLTKRPEEIYKPFGLTRANFDHYAKILDNHTDDEIKIWYSKYKLILSNKILDYKFLFFF